MGALTTIRQRAAKSIQVGLQTRFPGNRHPTPVADIPALTGIRFWAALWVLLLHYRYPPRSDAYALGFIFDHGLLGVPVFFILSGFILGHVYGSTLSVGDRRGVKRYLIYRVARIYPVHLFTLLIFAFVIFPFLYLPAAPTHQGGKVSDFFAHLFMVHAWGTAGYLTFNFPSWSISSEWFAYLLFPIIVADIRRLAPLKAFVLAIACCCLAAALPQPAALLDYGVMTLRVTILFVAGCALQRAMTKCEPSSKWDAVALGSLACLIASIWYSKEYLYPTGQAMLQGQYLAFVFAGALIGCLSLSRGAVAWFFGNPVAVYLGEISYSLYMSHMMVSLTERIYFKTLMDLWLAILIAVALAVLIYHGVEKPSRRAIRRLAERTGKLHSN